MLPLPRFRKQKQTAYQRSADPSQSVERLSQVDAAFCRLRFSQYGHIRIGGSFQTSQSAADNKERKQEELKTHDPFSRNEEQGTDAVQQQSCKHSCPVAVAPDNVSGRQGHQEIPSVHHRLNQGRSCPGDSQCILKMLVQYVQNTVGKSPQKEQGSDQNKRQQKVLAVPCLYQLHLFIRLFHNQIYFLETLQGQCRIIRFQDQRFPVCLDDVESRIRTVQSEGMKLFPRSRT